MRLQQVAYQPCGEGKSGQAVPLSLANSGAALEAAGRSTSSSDAGAIAMLTASSNRSNSASLIALSGFESARSQKSFVARLSGLFKLYRPDDRGRLGYRSINSSSETRPVRPGPNVRKITFGE